jgi:hypothetical protein
MSGRYDGAVKLTYQANGATVNYLAPRVLPMSPPGGTVTSVRPEEVNRLDLIANRALGNPTLGWQIADANNAMNPFDLCRGSGAVLQLPTSGL